MDDYLEEQNLKDFDIVNEYINKTESLEKSKTLDDVVKR